jgi:hypothetical protein
MAVGCCGDAEGFVEVLAGEGEGAGVGVEGGAGEEAEGEVVLLAGAADAVDGGCEVGDRRAIAHRPCGA